MRHVASGDMGRGAVAVCGLIIEEYVGFKRSQKIGLLHTTQE